MVDPFNAGPLKGQIADTATCDVYVCYVIVMYYCYVMLWVVMGMVGDCWVSVCMLDV